MKIPFNKPYSTGKEILNITDAIKQGHLSGNGKYTKNCQSFLEKKYSFKKTLLTTSCTDALEMSAILCNFKAGDEVIFPSFTFVTSVLAFIRQGITPIFVDSCDENPNIDVDKIESAITNKTKAIVIVHYAGIAVDIEKVLELSKNQNLILIEDCAQSIDSFYNNKPLGTFGDFATFSFHETKNINSGEGGMLVINNEKYFDRSEIIWEKGTNRSSFFRGEIDKYGWVDNGSSFLPSEIIAAFLYAQLESINEIQHKRIEIWNSYQNGLKDFFNTPKIPEYASNNAHMFYIIFENFSTRNKFINYMKKNSIHTVFHYSSLHKSKYYTKNFKRRFNLTNSDFYSDTLLRLPLYPDLSTASIEKIISLSHEFNPDKISV